jgi:hypothetical protein
MPLLVVEKTLQEKLSIVNPSLKAASSIDPRARGHSISLSYLQKLPGYMPNVLCEDEVEKYDLEVKKYQTVSLSVVAEDMRTDHWWVKPELISKYPCLSKIVYALYEVAFMAPKLKPPST